MNKLVLHNYYRSSTSYRARIALHLKNLDFEYVPVHLLNNGGEQFREDYKQLNPASEVPTLVHNGHVIAQSMAVIEYLDQVFPQVPLFPQDPVERAVVKQISENINCAHSLTNLKVMKLLTHSYSASEEQKTQWTHEWMGRVFAATEKILQKTAGTFAFGGSVTAADIFIVPHLYSASRFSAPIDSYPILKRVNEACLKHPAFIKAHPSRQVDTPAEMRV